MIWGGGVVASPLSECGVWLLLQDRKVNTLTVKIKKTVSESKKIAINTSPSIRFFCGVFEPIGLSTDLAPFSLISVLKLYHKKRSVARYFEKLFEKKRQNLLTTQKICDTINVE